jgi:hypothetical protein
MKKLTLTAAAAAIVSAGLVLSATAQTPGQFKQMPIGEKGAKSGNMCWVDTSGGGMFGYWAACPKKVAKR